MKMRERERERERERRDVKVCSKKNTCENCRQLDK